jgi:hypothetical protein
MRVLKVPRWIEIYFCVRIFTMAGKHPRISREGKTIAVMIALYCRDQHEGDELCPECHELLDYAIERLEKCPFQEGKTTCAKCAVHCFKPAVREQVRTVMRYSGPRMIYRHPVQAIFHIIDGLRKEPVSPLS